jgi:hypothetical protein
MKNFKADLLTGIYIGIGLGIADMVLTILTKLLNVYGYFYQ